MPPTRPLSTPCRYGYNCTRSDCFYTHPKGTSRNEQPLDEKPLCTFGRGCFRKVCYDDHPNGRAMDQMKADVDYSATWMLVRPYELMRVSAAFQAAFPAPNDGKDRCDFVAAVPISVAYHDWKTYRGISATGTPNGVPSTPQKIQLYPRTRKGERLLQVAENRVGMRWSPTPSRPWKTLERMTTHDLYWEQNQDSFLLCAGYEASPPGSGVFIELAVTGLVKEEDGGDGLRAGARVAREVMGLPDAIGQRWFVFHLSRPEESGEEAQFITVRALVDTSKMPTAPRRSDAIGEPRLLQQQPPPPLQAGTVTTGAPRGAVAPAPAAIGAPPQTVMVTAPRGQLDAVQQRQRQQSHYPPKQFHHHHHQQQQQQQQQQQVLTTPATSAGSSPSSPYAFSNSTSAASSYSPKYSGAVNSGSFMVEDNATGAAATAGTTPSARTVAHAPPAQVLPSPSVGSAGQQQQQQQQQQQARNSEVDELSELLARLNMTKYRAKFDSQNVDFKALKTMTAEKELSGIGIPLGPRIKLMKELGIERS